MKHVKNIFLIQRVSCDYHKKFFLSAKKNLSDSGISLKIISGDPWEAEGLIDVLDDLDFGIRVKNLRIFGKLYWQKGIIKITNSADLVVIDQSNSSLINYFFLIKKKFGRKGKIAYWGHGANLNSLKREILRESWKRWLVDKVDWWFAYTFISNQVVKKSGFPSDRISIINNSIDSITLMNERSKLDDHDLNTLHSTIFPQDNSVKTDFPTGVYCGRLTKYKYIPFLMESIKLIHDKLPNFRMIIVGDGTDRDVIESFCRSNNWVKCVGAKHGIDRVKYLALGDLWLNPGAVGLAIIDSFCFGIPILTTNLPIHGPEIAYLKNGINGLMIDHSPEKYSDAVLNLLKNKNHFDRIKKGAKKSSLLYSSENMADNFANGVIKCLST